MQQLRDTVDQDLSNNVMLFYFLSFSASLKHVHLSFRFSAPVYIYLLIHFGQHITPLPVKMSVNENKQTCRVWYTFVCAATCLMYTVTSPHYKKGGRRIHKKLVSYLLCRLNMYTGVLFPELTPFSARHSSLGRVTRWELWVWLLHGEETSTSKRGQKEKLKSRVLGERRQTAYQRLINPWRVICTVRPLRIGIRTKDARGEQKGMGGWGARGVMWQ